MQRLDEQRTSTFARLFKGRMDAYGTEEGGCERVAQWAWPVYESHINEHLHGYTPMGVYPMINDSEQEWVVFWGCVDFDEGDEVSFIHATNLQTVLDAFDISSWVERSRSKGYHVWVFAKEAISAPRMRRALLAACDIAKAPTKEINPKAEGFFTTDDNGNEIPDWSKIGNYVRLPYPQGWEETHRRCMVDNDGYPIDVATFTDIAFPTRITDDELEPLLELYVPPVKTQFNFNGVTATDPSELPSTREMNSTAYNAWKHGPFEGCDRSSTLWKLAKELRNSGYGFPEAMAFVNDADRRWGKHHARGDLDRLEKMVIKVYQA